MQGGQWRLSDVAFPNLRSSISASGGGHRRRTTHSRCGGYFLALRHVGRRTGLFRSFLLAHGFWFAPICRASKTTPIAASLRVASFASTGVALGAKPCRLADVFVEIPNGFCLLACGASLPMDGRHQHLGLLGMIPPVTALAPGLQTGGITRVASKMRRRFAATTSRAVFRGTSPIHECRNLVGPVGRQFDSALFWRGVLDEEALSARRKLCSGLRKQRHAARVVANESSHRRVNDASCAKRFGRAVAHFRTMHFS